MRLSVGFSPALSNHAETCAFSTTCSVINIDRKAAMSGLPLLGTFHEFSVAAGDVRSASMKRVAAAVGEGSSVIPSVHRAIGVLL